jgi:CDP-diglyceride synthetase
MNGGVIAAAIIALPIYFVRTRGWKRGALTTLGALVVFGLTFVLGELGEWLGKRLL